MSTTNTTNQPLVDDAAYAVARADALTHLRQAAQALESVSDYMAWLTRTMISELEARKAPEEEAR